MKGSRAMWFFGTGAIVKIGIVVAMALAAKSAVEPALERALPVAVSVVSPLPASFERIDPGNGNRYEIWALAVPESSVHHDQRGAFVYAVDADGVARATRIDTGDRRDGLVEVPWGLSFDAHVIDRARGAVNDGELVRVETNPANQLANASDRSES